MRMRGWLSILCALLAALCVRDLAHAQADATHAAPSAYPRTTPCPTQVFFVDFPGGGAALDATALTAITENLNQARPCLVLVAFVAGRALGQARAVGDAMLAQGYPLEWLEIVELNEPVKGPPPENNRVVVAILFR